MLLCFICHGDASTSGTKCVKCMEYIGDKCHGGDGYIVCIKCTGKYTIILSSFPNISILYND